MTNNNFNSTNYSYDVIPKQFINYINYELTFFEKITNKKFFVNIVSQDRLELNVCGSKEEEYNNKSEYQIIYRANNLYQFIKKLFMIREHLIKNFDIK